MSKTIKTIFTLSFLLNIILIGIVLGGMLKQKRGTYFDNIAVSQETKSAFKKTMNQNRQEMRTHFEQMREYKKELRSIIIADDFDGDAYAAQMDKILTVKNTMAVQKAKTLGQTLSGLSQAERKEISGHVLKKLSGKRHVKRKERGQGRNGMNN